VDTVQCFYVGLQWIQFDVFLGSSGYNLVFTTLSPTVFLHSCRFRSCPGGDSNERGGPASTVQSTAIMAPDHRLLHEKYGLLSRRTIAIEGGQHWRKTVVV